jgi:hypothetical protein
MKTDPTNINPNEPFLQVNRHNDLRGFIFPTDVTQK